LGKRSRGADKKADSGCHVVVEEVLENRINGKVWCETPMDRLADGLSKAVDPLPL
jgi:hypothetical protein